jgi:hypothetical protein
MTTKTREYFLQIKVYFVAICQKPCEKSANNLKYNKEKGLKGNYSIDSLG